MSERDPAFATIRSGITGIGWPPVVPGPTAAMAALAQQLDHSQWLAPDVIVNMQYRQLGNVVAHHWKYSSQFRNRLRDANLEVGDLLSPAELRQLPVMGRRQLQSVTDFGPVEVPPDHLPLTDIRTSGSTGEPVTIKTTRVSNLDWRAHTIRMYLWSRCDFSKRSCTIRITNQEIVRARSWSGPTAQLFDTGPSMSVPVHLDIDRQIELIREFAPDILLLYPSNLNAIIQSCIARKISLPSIRKFFTISETLHPRLRSDVRALLGVEIFDCYSSMELGYIALQCPDSDLYHVMGETRIVEILRDDGTPCGEGEIGRVVITDLRNFATPMIRYANGDYAEPGPICSCGRGLPTLRRIHGRERNLVRFPDGTRNWPTIGDENFCDGTPILQYQIVQESLESIEMRLVTERALSKAEERAIGEKLCAALRYNFTIRFNYFEGRLPLGPSGKFEEFICKVI